MLDKKQRDQILTKISFLCWAIWKSRCRFVYQGMPLNPRAMILEAENLAAEFGDAVVLRFSPIPGLSSRSATSKIWCPPPSDFTKLNSDGAWSDPTQAGLGVIIRNSAGDCIGGAAMKSNAESADRAEAEALLLAVSLAKERNLKKVVFESDSQLLINDSGSC